MKKSLLGGLLKELELKIKASQEVLAFYESEMAKLQIQVDNATEQYHQSYDYYWIKSNQLMQKNFNLLACRQSIMNRLRCESEELEMYKNNLFHQTQVNSFLQKIYTFIISHFNFTTKNQKKK